MSQHSEENLIDKIVSLCKRRGFVFPGSEIYGGLANSWDYGPLGVELKNNIKNLWWDQFARKRNDVVGIDAALLMNPKVWEASGHLKEFADPLVECEHCHKRFRLDELSEISNIQDAISKFRFHRESSVKPGQIRNIKFKIPKCPECEGKLTEPRQFNLMLKTFLGPAEDEAAVVYFRPETAQGMFVNFKNVVDTMRPRLPFGIAQIGKAFRNEITPGNFIFRMREFEQMEIEYFVKEADWEKYFEHWRQEMIIWMQTLGLDTTHHIHELEVPVEERAHYSKRTIDFEYDFPFGKKELYGLAYRTDFDLKNHFKNAPYRDAENQEEFWPHVIEPTWGVDRSVLAVLCEAYTEVEDIKGNKRIYLKIPPKIAPYKVAIFPLLANKPQLVEKARKIYNDLKTETYNLTSIAWDDRGNVGKRYYAQDEIGTPWCVTVDFQTLEDETVTVRDRDTTAQIRKRIDELGDCFGELLRN